MTGMNNDNFESSNPYAGPVGAQGYNPGPLPGGAGGTYVRQLKPLCICMIIQGVLEILVGIGYEAMAFAMPAMLNQAGAGGGPGIPPEQQQFMEMMFLVMYGGGGLATLIAGVVRIVGGVRGLSMKGYAVGITSHLLGLMSLFSCYCLPTSMALAVWGSIVYFNFEVKQAFKLVADGHEPKEVEAKMSGYRH